MVRHIDGFVFHIETEAITRRMRTPASIALPHRIRSFAELMKPRLSLLVAFSSAFGFVLGSSGRVDWASLAVFFAGGFLVSAASVTWNQVIEHELDALMDRTKNRPLPSSRVSVGEAQVFAWLCLVAGLALLYLSANWLTVLLSVASSAVYCLAYTPLKRKGPVAVFVGALPGALPPLLGWLGATGSVSHEAMIIFGIQFVWQFPHFWAIAWVADDDYRKAGFKLLPSGGGRDLSTAIQIMVYTLFLIPLGLLPAVFGITGIHSAFIATACGVLFLAQTFSLMRTVSRESALKIMFGSFLYLPIVQIAYLLDKV
jgi:protoheme IX farnesyltransferase